VNLNIDLNTAEFRMAAQRAVRELRANSTELIREEARLFIGEFMKLTPPFAKGNYGKSIGNSADFEAGKKLITHDLAQVAGHAEEGFLHFVVKEFGGTTQIRKQFFKKGSKKPYLIDWDKVAFTTGELSKFHRSKMDKRGRPPNHYKMGDKSYGRADNNIGRWVAKQKLIVPNEVYSRYLADLIYNVGAAKATFNAAAMILGMKRIPPWVRRHGDLGSYSEEGSGETFAVTLGGRSHVPGAQGAANMAIAIRGKKLTAEIQRLVNSFASTGKILTRRKSFNSE